MTNISNLISLFPPFLSLFLYLSFCLSLSEYCSEIDHFMRVLFFQPHPKYEFNYGVQDRHTGDHKSQHEIRDGDVVKGTYTVAEPDGTLRTVHYTADDHNGFNAIVEKSGHPVHPAPAPAYAKAIVTAPAYYHH